MRATWMVHLIPFDSSIEFHKIIAYMILLASVIHTVAHFGNYTTVPDKTFTQLLFSTNAGLTGFVLLVIMLIMYVVFPIAAFFTPSSAL
jgi:hypothetical protein